MADLYDIKVQDIDGLRGTRTKSAIKVVEGIRNTSSVPFERVVFALGIRFVGETTAKLLARRFKTMEALSSATLDNLLSVEGIGSVIAGSVVEFFNSEENLNIIRRLAEHGVKMAVDENDMEGASDILEGKSIVISGVFTHHSRDEYKEIIELNGGKNVGSISAKTSFILAGQNMGPAKLEKAQKLNIPIYNEEEFLEMIKKQ